MQLDAWLQRLARAAARLYYRCSYAGPRVPPAGPVLLVANHPNALLDPILVLAAAKRPARFLAKAPLFHIPVIGRLVRAIGCIPVYRQQDDPAAMGRNVDSLRAAEQALAAGSAIALFPEGISHDSPALSPLKTGAARIALGAAAMTGAAVPIIPLGILLREKDIFRSEALVVAGDPVAWEDLAARGAADHEATRDLTARIDDALRTVTVNLERWEDAPVVECAEEIWAAEYGTAHDAAERVERLRVVTDLLARIRSDPGARISVLVHAVRRHARSLRRLGLSCEDLDADIGAETALWWSFRRIPLVLLPVVIVGAASWLLWWPPYRLTGLIAGRLRGTRDIRSTYKLFGGAVVYLAWLVLITVAAARRWGTGAAAMTAIGAPVAGAAGLWIRERWHAAWLDVRRYFLLRRRPTVLRDLRRRQREVAERLNAIYESRR